MNCDNASSLIIRISHVLFPPSKSLVLYNQMVGRAMRGINVGGNKTCEIRIIKDDALSQFTNPVDNFFKWDDVW